jgi:hypothetical protein
MSKTRATPRTLFNLFRQMSEEDQLKFLRMIDDDESGFTNPVIIESLNLAYFTAADIAATERAHRELLSERWNKRNRKPDPFTIRLALEVGRLKGEGVNWREMPQRILARFSRHHLGLPEGPLSKEEQVRLSEHCRKAWRDHINKKAKKTD